MRIVLHDWGPSPFCLKVRSILDFKGIAYERRMLDPLSLVTVVRRGKIGKVPALELGERFVADSTDIALALEDLAPEPAILPRGARERALCHAIEEWADESVYWVGLYLMWSEPEGARLVPRAFRGPNKLIYPFYRRRVLGQIVAQGTGRKPHAHVLSDLERHLDATEGLLGGDYLLGGAPTLADFALAAQLVYLSRTPVGGRALAARPTIGAYLERMRGLREAAKR